MKKSIGVVSSEGGPYLIADAATARSWRGIDGPEYDELCLQLDARSEGVLHEFRSSTLSFLTWEPGVGGVDVFLDDGQVTLVHPSNAPSESSLSMQTSEFELEVGSGVLAILWAPESGECIKDQDLAIQKARPPSGMLAIDESSLLVPIVSGRYRCLVATKKIKGQDVKRLLLCKR